MPIYGCKHGIGYCNECRLDDIEIRLKNLEKINKKPGVSFEEAIIAFKKGKTIIHHHPTQRKVMTIGNSFEHVINEHEIHSNAWEIIDET